jgi:hypothetical protein
MNIKKFRLPLFSLIFVAFACKNEQKVPNERFTINAKSAIDTLRKYQNVERIFMHKPNFSIFIENQNYPKVGIITISHQAYYIFQKTTDDWQLIDQTDSLEINQTPETIDLVDLNGDGKKDIRCNHTEGSGDFSITQVWLFDKAKQTFYRNKNYELDDAEYDKVSKMLISSHLGKEYSFIKRYKIIGDSLKLHDEFELTEKHSSDIPDTIFCYKYSKNKKILIKKIVQPNATAVFEKLF